MNLAVVRDAPVQQVGDHVPRAEEPRSVLRQADFGSAWTRFPIARLRYTRARRERQIYWRDRNLKFHVYDRVAPTANVEALLAEIDADADPTGMFWS